MTSSPAFCTNCGAAIADGARFCGSCGRALDVPVPPPVTGASVPPPPPVPAVPPAVNAPASDRVMDVIGFIRQRKGFMGTSATVYHLVLTTQQAIFALQTPEMQKQDAAAARASAKGVFGKIGAGLASRKGDKYLSVDPAIILQEVPGNFAIPYADIARVEIYAGNFDDNEPDIMIIITNSGKHEFQIENLFQVKRQLQAVLPNKVK